MSQRRAVAEWRRNEEIFFPVGVNLSAAGIADKELLRRS
jgi:hypothetical protein